MMFGRTGKQFLRYYIIFFVCLVLLFIPFYYINLSMVSRNYIETASAMLKTGLANFEDDLSQIETISINAFSNPRFRRFSYISSGYSINDYYNAVNLVNDFNRYFAAAGMIADCGIIFGNEFILTSKALHFSGDDFYRYYSKQNDADYEQWTAEMSENVSSSMISTRLIPLASFSSWGTNYTAITYINNFSSLPGKTSFFFAALKIDYILSRLATDEVLREGRIIMYDPAGIVLLDSGPGNEPEEKSINIGMKGEKRGIVVAVDIPNYIFTGKMAPFRRFAFVFTLIYIMSGAVLSIIFAQRSARPVQKLIDEASNFREKYRQQEENQRRNLLLRLFYDSAYPAEISGQIKNYLPDFPDKFRIAAIDLPGMTELPPGTQTTQQTIIRELTESRLPRGGYANFSGNTLLLLLPDDRQIARRLQEIAAELREKMDISGRIALSETAEGVQDAHNAFSQVRHLLRLPRSISEGEILQKETSPSFSSSIEFLDTSRFYELLLHGEEDKAAALLNDILNQPDRYGFTDENDIQQIFFLYRRIFVQIVTDLKLGEKEKIIPDYDPDKDIDSLFNEIIKSVRIICDKIKLQYEEQNTEFEQSIIKYIDDNITNKNLYTKMVTGNFKINENRLQNIIRQRTGKSYFDYVESRRMALAKDFLQNTGKSISVITRECGYSTQDAFYKAFKRHFDMAPRDLRH